MRNMILALTLLMSTNQLCFGDEIENGVSLELATQRKAAISNVEYDLKLALKPTGPIESTLKIRFDLADTKHPIVLDFNAPEKNVSSVSLNKVGAKDWNKSVFEIKNGHIVVPVKHVEPGRHNLDQQLRCLLYTSPSPRDRTRSRMPSSA